ncbi:MAG: gamma-glutamyl-gamma-aminobutyrate hydrolase family protein [Pseudonocardia sp.]
MVSNGSEDPRVPLVGLTSYGERVRFGVWDLDAVLLPRDYVDMVVASGGTPVLLPSVPAAAGAVDVLDALVITGGPDVDPAGYGAEPHPRTGAPRAERDEAECAMLRRALDRGIPVLGVCRGLQVLNVALGGTLAQHLPELVGHDGHNPSPGVFGSTTVTLDRSGRIGTAIGARIDALCHHHQAVDRLADGLVVTGRAADGTIEAVELAAHRFVVAVQWHPEQSAKDHRLFAALVDAAAGTHPGATQKGGSSG